MFNNLEQAAHQALARQYRPQDFANLVGQEHVVRALSHALTTGRLHHAYLFTGTRGVGKTTLARILAKALNCIGADGQGSITATPCGVCSHCVAISKGHCIDYIELDAASNRGVDEMVQLLEQAVYAPSSTRFKVYVIDEVHMLTNHAFNAMLKTLEEPPPHIKFILATTDPQKIPVTVLSRCLQFNLKQMSAAQIVDYLQQVLNQEQIHFEAPALHLIARAAQGSMRDALSITDQAIAYSAGQLHLETVQNMLGTLDQRYLIKILDALVAQNGQALLDIAKQMSERSLSYASALQDLARLFHRIALLQKIPSAEFEDTLLQQELNAFVHQFTAEQVQLFYQIAIQGRHELKLAPDEYAGFTMTLLRMLAFYPSFAKPDYIDSAFAKTVTMPTAVVTQTITRTNTQSSSSLLQTKQPTLASPESENKVFAVQAPVATTTSTGAWQNWDQNWPALAARLPLRGVVQQLALQSELVRCTPQGLHLRVIVEAYAAPQHLEKLSNVLSEYFGQTIKITAEAGQVAQTAHQQKVEQHNAKIQQIQNAIIEDPIVQQLQQQFNATIDPQSIRTIAKNNSEDSLSLFTGA